MAGKENHIIEEKPRSGGVSAAGQGGVGTLEQVAPGTLGSPSCFETIYSEAQGDPSVVPWAHCRPNPSLVSWLNAEAAGRVRPGSRAIVIGCGLGDDVVELLGRGYDATGFDISPTAIQWARKRFPQHAEAFSVTDLLELPTRYRHRFELIIEAYTLQALHPVYREQAARAVASLCGPRGLVLTIARGRDEGELLEHVGAPPWPLTRSELLGLMEASGLKPARAIDDFLDDETPPKRRLRGVFERA